jgi:anti-anti-sigma factor
MRLALHIFESEVTLRVNSENKIYILNHDELFNEAASLLRGPISMLILDLENIKIIDSAGLGSLIKLNRMATDMNKSFRIANLSENTMELFELLKLSEAFDLKANNSNQISSAA